jgi:hypothetical protein
MNFAPSSKFFPLTSAFRRAIFRRQRVVLDLVFVERRRIARIVDQHQHLVLANDLADPDLDLGDDPAFQVLHDLDLARRNDFAFADGGLADVSERGPEDERSDEGDGAPDQHMRVRRRALQCSRRRLAHELDVFAPIQRRRRISGFHRGLTRALRH